MPAGMHIRVIMNKEKGKNNIKKRKPVKTKRNSINSVANSRNTSKAT